MKNFLLKLISMIIPVSGSFLGVYLFNEHHAALWYPVFTFIVGLSFAIIFIIIGNWYHNITLGTYKRKLEKESVTSDENSAKVKVLESKIQVLEKALENAINKV